MRLSHPVATVAEVDEALGQSTQGPVQVGPGSPQRTVGSPLCAFGSGDGALSGVPVVDRGWVVYSEGWGPAYGVSADFDSADDVSGDSAEQAEPGDWPVARAEPQAVPLAFVDGVRRVELRTWAEHAVGGMRIPGLAGAFAVGAVTVRPGGQMRFEGIRIGRVAVWGGGHSGDLVSRRSGYVWVSAPVTGTEPDDCLAHLQDRMRRAEGDLALDAANAGWNVVLDGPLNRIRSLHGLVAGYVKSHLRRLLPDRAHAAVPTLAVGERTRLYTAGSDRWTCYVRIGDPKFGASRWSGIARLEFSSGQGLVAVCARASMLASVLPVYAGVAHHDERAPVNLRPVNNLEQFLHRSLGNATLANRAAREVVAEGRPLLPTLDLDAPSANGASS